MNEGMTQAIEELSVEKNKEDNKFISHPDSIYSGAIGAALWGGFRYYKLKEKQAAVVA